MLPNSKIALSLVHKVTLPAVLTAIVVIAYSGAFQTTAATGAAGIEHTGTILR
jgi:hypothetical protein